MRNQFIHARTDRQGRPYIRMATAREISEAYSAVIKVCDIFVSEVEALVSGGVGA